jgi:hypothetical protein
MGTGSWIDDLLDVLCKIYKSFGGDCSDFEGDPHKAVTLVVDAYHTQGAPVFKTPQEKAAFLALLDELEALLAMPANSLAPADTLSLTVLIAELRKDIG